MVQGGITRTAALLEQTPSGTEPCRGRIRVGSAAAHVKQDTSGAAAPSPPPNPDLGRPGSEGGDAGYGAVTAPSHPAW